ncbi:putative type II secretion system protein HxcR [bacterium HR11]|nr:putative type II secretion system protein HxcR [bacterium HR11]
MRWAVQVAFLVYECMAEWRPASSVECWICGHGTPLVVEGIPLCLGCLLATRGLRTGRPPGPASAYMYPSIVGEALPDAGWQAVALRQAELLSPTAGPVCPYEVERVALTRVFGPVDVARLLRLPLEADRPAAPLPVSVRRLWPLERARSTGIVPVEAVLQGSGRIRLTLAGLPAEGDLADLLEACALQVAELTVQMTALDPRQEREALLTCLYTEGLPRRIALPADRPSSPPTDGVSSWETRAVPIDPQAIQPTVRSGAESVRVLILEAYRQGASDIHVEPYPMEDGWGTRIRFRVDGLLQDVLRVREPLWQSIGQALKHLCRMTAGVALAPRDGSFTADLEGTPVHLRVSIIPAGPEAGGESAVIRILQQDMLRYTWAELGLMGPAWEALEAALREPWGMVVVAGPTGSGKSTTFHKLVQRLPAHFKVLTVEDPIEYVHPGIVQCQVSEHMSFACAVRAFLRQDPDVILVGEVRDAETARAALEAASTGHLVLTTVHAHTALQVVDRLERMDLDRAWVARVLRVVATQELVRRPCPHCGEWASPEEVVHPALQVRIREAGVGRVWVGRGCSRCAGRGLARGGGLTRVPVLSTVTVSDDVRLAIEARRRPGEVLRVCIAAGGYVSRWESALFLTGRRLLDGRYLNVLGGDDV